MDGEDLTVSVAAEAFDSTVSNHGWQKVTNPKKQRRQENGKESKKSGDSKNEVSAKDGKLAFENGGSAFAALDLHSKERRAKIEAGQVAELIAERARNASDDDDEDEDDLASYGLNGLANGNGVAGEEKKKEKKPKKPKVTVAEAATAMGVEDLSAFLVQITESFASLPDVQLMRCVDYFAGAFSGVTLSLVNIQKIIRETSLTKAIEVPLADIPEAIVTTTADWLLTKPVEELGKLLIFLVKAAVEDAQPIGSVPKHQKAAQPTAPAKAKVGMLVVLAILLRRKPDIMLQQAEAIRSSPHCQGQERLQVLAWVYGQVAAVDLVPGMWLWVRNLLPYAAGKLSTPISRDISLSFLETVIFKNLKKARPVLISGAFRKGERLVPPAEFNLILRAAFPLEGAKTKATERFEALYPVVKEVALVGSLRSKSAKPAALQLLPLAFHAISESILPASLMSAKGSSNQRLLDEASSIFVWCLSENVDCYKQWEKHHPEDVTASTHMLTYLSRNWTEVKGRLSPFSDLSRFLRAIRKKNVAALAELSSDDYDEKRRIKAADAASATLQRKLSSLGGCINTTATLLVAGAMAYGFYLLSPAVNPWGWDGFILLSKTHRPF